MHILWLGTLTSLPDSVWRSVGYTQCCDGARFYPLMEAGQARLCTAQRSHHVGGLNAATA